MTTPIPHAAIGATAPTSRSTFRLLAGCVDATNRDADTLRHALTAQWVKHAGVHVLEGRLHTLDSADPAGDQGADARLAIWFTFADPGDGRLVADDDPVLAGLSDAFRARLAETARPAQD